MEEKTQNIQQQAENKDDNKHKKASHIAAVIGFSLVGLAALVLIGTMVFNIISSNNKVVESKVTAFKNEKQITSKLKSVLKKSEKYYSTTANYLRELTDNSVQWNEQPDSSTDDSEQMLNNHSAYSQSDPESVADTVKTDNKYIYYLPSGGGSKISVFSAEGKDSRYVSELNISNNENETFLFNCFYVIGKKLIAVEEEKISVSSDIAKTVTRIETFDISDIKSIKSIGKYTQSGKYCSSKVIDGTLYLTTVHHSADAEDLPRAAYGDDTLTDGNVISAENIYYTDNPSEPNFMVTGKVNLAGTSKSVSAKALFGSTDNVFFSGNSLYLTSYEFNDNIFDKQNMDKASYIHLPVDSTYIIKVDLKDNLNFVASAKVVGYTDSQYSFDESDGYLRVASSQTLDNDKFTESVNMFVLDKDLKCVGKITDFVNNETVKAVRYIDDTAYVMTYKASDPLFIIDLKNSSEPKILGETKISGFSSTLVPVDKNTLLSVGYYTAKENGKDSDGIKIVAFDVSNKTNPKKSDEKIYKNYESPVQYNANALLINSEKEAYTIPMVYEYYNDKKSRQENKFGSLTFKVENGKINILNDHTSTLFTDSDDSIASLDRCVSVGDYIYMLGSDFNYYKAEGNALIEAIKY